MNYTAIAAILAVVCAGMLAATPPATRRAPSAPPSAQTTDEIEKAFEPYKGVRGREVDSALFNRNWHRIFAIWCCPGSGSGYCVLWAYYYDFKTGQWNSFVDAFVDGGGDLSPEIPSTDEIVFRSGGGAVVLKRDLSALPRNPQ